MPSPNIDYLDTTLLLIKQNSKYSEENVEIPKEYFKEHYPIAMRHLEKDGYIRVETNQKDQGTLGITAYITFAGLLALENNPFIWKNKPYRWNKIKGIITISWTVAKMIMVALNAVIILYLTYLSVKK